MLPLISIESLSRRSIVRRQFWCMIIPYMWFYQMFPSDCITLLVLIVPWAGGGRGSCLEGREERGGVTSPSPEPSVPGMAMAWHGMAGEPWLWFSLKPVTGLIPLEVFLTINLNPQRISLHVFHSLKKMLCVCGILMSSNNEFIYFSLYISIKTLEISFRMHKLRYLYFGFIHTHNK